jgi:S-adenosylmethionine hydrolase
VILGIVPGASIVDISHAAGPQNIAEGSFLLQSAYRYFPADTIHVGVIDPGVGTERLPIAVAMPHGVFVGPDNGLFAPIVLEQGLLELSGTLEPPGRAVVLENPAVRLPQVSATFHGRDIFAPAAAHLARGIPLQDLGPVLETIKVPAGRGPRRDEDGSIHGEVVHIDHFGNAVSNIPGSWLNASATVVAAGRAVGRLVETYQTGTLVALTGSTGLVEVAVTNGSAAKELDLHVGDTVQVLER